MLSCPYGEQYIYVSKPLNFDKYLSCVVCFHFQGFSVKRPEQLTEAYRAVLL